MFKMHRRSQKNHIITKQGSEILILSPSLGIMKKIERKESFGIPMMWGKK